MVQRVFVDANILFSKTLMDWLFLLRIANGEMFHVHTSEDVMAEVIANMRRRNPLLPGEHTRHRADLIRRSLDEIVDAFPSDVPFSGQDEDDYHVHAAATASSADMLLTNNKPADFTDHVDHETYEIITADDFFILVVDSNPVSLLTVIAQQLEYWIGSEKTLDQALARADCPKFAKRVASELEQRFSTSENTTATKHSR